MPSTPKKKRGRGRPSALRPFTLPKLSSYGAPPKPPRTRVPKPQAASGAGTRRATRAAEASAKAVRLAHASRPIETLAKAEAKIARTTDATERRKLQEATRRLRHALASEANFRSKLPTPEGSPSKENFPLKALKDVAPRAYEKARRQARGGHRSSKGLGEPEDLTTAITLAAPGGGLVASLGRKAAEEGAEAAAKEIGGKIAGKVGSEGEQTIAEDAGKKAATKLRVKAGDHVKARVDRVKTAPERTARRVKEAPGKARRAATTPEGRRAAGEAAARKAARHPLRTGVPLAAASPVPLPGELDKRARAFLKGTGAALTHPGKLAETTGQAGLGLLTFPLAAGGAAVESVKHGSPEPLEELAKRTIYVPGGKGKGKSGTSRPSGLVGMAESLASGDPHRVEETTLQESGLTPFLPAPALVRRLKGTDAYEGLRARVRDAAEEKRKGPREAAKADMSQRAAEGRFVSPKEVRKARRKEAVPDTSREGQNYVLRRTGRLIEKQRGRHWLAREVGRMQHEGQLSSRGAAEKIAKVLRKSAGTDQTAQNYGEAFRIVARHGLPADEARGLAFVRKLHERWPKVEAGDVPPGVHLDRHSTEFILTHPKIFSDPHFWQAIKVADEVQKAVGTSERNRFLAQVHNLINPELEAEGKGRILTPEEMVPDSVVKLLPKRGKREQPWNRSEALTYMKTLANEARGHTTNGRPRPTDSQLAELKAAKELERRGLAQKGTVPKGAHLAVAKSATTADRALLRLEALKREMAPLMKPPEHGGAAGGVSTTKAVPYTPEMVKAFTKAARREGKRLGLREPNPYIADVMPSTIGGGDSFPDYAGLNPLRKVWPSQGKALRSGNALSDFESVLRHSVEGPRVRLATSKGLQRIFDKGSRKIDGRRYFTYKQWEHAANKGEIPAGVVPIRTQFLRALAEDGDHPVDPDEFKRAVMEELEHGQRIIGSAKELAGEMRDAQSAGVKGEKFAAMDATLMGELVRHMEGPSSVSRSVGHASNFAMRAILNSPAFAASQFAQEGLPAAAALGRDVVHVPRAIKNLKEIDKLPVEDQAAIKAAIGAGTGLQGIPVDPLRDGAFDPIRAAGSPKLWRHVWDLANGNTLKRFDLARAGRFREVAALARVHGELKRAEPGFKRWRASAKGLFKDMHGAVNDMKNMGIAERHLYIAEHPELADRMTKEMRGMMGDWNSFTAFEKNFAPFTVFYAFQRYAALWGLVHFPLDHPFVSTALALYGAVNAHELKRIAATKGAAPGPLDYTKAVIPTGGGHSTVLAGGQRFAPILGSGEQAVIEGKPTQALGGLSPALGIPLEAMTGKSFYTGEALKEPGFEYALRQAVATSPLLRFLGLPQKWQSKSAASQAYAQQDPDRQVRSVLNPYAGQGEGHYAAERKLAQEFERKYGKGRIPGPFDSPMVQDLLYGGPGGTPQPQKLSGVLSAIHGAERAGNYVKRAERPFNGPEKPFGPQRKELLEEVENAWETGPNASSGSGWRSSGTSSGGGWRTLGAGSKGGWR
jgi:hypothetical protein